MTDLELMRLQSKLENAKGIQTSLKKFDEVLEHLEHMPHCKEFTYKYLGKSSGLFGGDENETVEVDLSISAESLGITQKVFDDWFTYQNIAQLKSLRAVIQEQYDNLKIEL